MKYFLSILGLGDTLITSRILDSYPSEITDNISIITSTYGINIVKKFSKLHSITAITEKIPRFYNVSDNSIPIVINSLLQFRDQINKFLEPGDLIIHEKQLGLRELFLRLGSKGHNIYPQYISNVYLDRVKLFNKVLNYEVDLSGYRLQYEKRNIVVINPCAGKKDRELPLSVTENIISHFQEKGTKVYLFDFDGKYQNITNDDAYYLFKPNLDTSTSILRQAKYYCGPDSFNLHLAYLYNCKIIGFFMRNWVYFKPTDIEQTIFYDQTENHQLIGKVISEF